MKRLLIVGAGGFGREVWAWAQDVMRAERCWEFGGFLDRNPEALARYLPEAEIVGDPECYSPAGGDVLLCAVGDPETKLRLSNELEGRGASFVTLRHPSAIVGPGCSVGRGCVLCPQVVLTTNVTVGDFVTVNLNSTIGHDAVIGDGHCPAQAKWACLDAATRRRHMMFFSKSAIKTDF